MGRGAASQLCFCDRTDLFEIRPFLRALVRVAICLFDVGSQVQQPLMRLGSTDSARGLSGRQTVVAL